MRNVLVALAVLVGASGAHGHGGGLDANGCHTNRKTGDYHCHRSPPVAPPPPNDQNRAALMRDYQANFSNECHIGPRGGRYRIVNGKKRYGC